MPIRKSQGLFAGVSLEGNGIFIAKKANQRFHGNDSAADILASRTPARRRLRSSSPQ